MRLQDGRVSGIWRVVGGHVVERAACRKGKPTLQSELIDQQAALGLQFLTNLNHRHAGLDPGLHVLAHLQHGVNNA